MERLQGDVTDAEQALLEYLELKEEPILLFSSARQHPWQNSAAKRRLRRSETDILSAAVKPYLGSHIDESMTTSVNASGRPWTFDYLAKAGILLATRTENGPSPAASRRGSLVDSLGARMHDSGEMEVLGSELDRRMSINSTPPSMTPKRAGRSASESYRERKALGQKFMDASLDAKIPMHDYDVADCTLPGIEPEQYRRFLYDFWQTDWASTSLGAPNTWSNTLRCLVDTILLSPTPTLMCWSDDLVCVYNYAHSISMGARHPAMLGTPYFAVWPELYDQMVQILTGCFAGKVVYYDEAQLFLTVPNGLEERYFSYSMIPMRTCEGVPAVFVPNFDTTASVLSRRRMKTLHILAGETADCASLDQYWARITDTLIRPEICLDTPYATFYTRVGDRPNESAAGFKLAFSNVACATLPPYLDLALTGDSAGPLPAAALLLQPYLHRLHKGETAIELDDQTSRTLYAGVKCPSFGDLIERVVIMAIRINLADPIEAVCLMCLSTRRDYDEAYVEFIHLMRRQLSAGTASIRLVAQARKQAAQVQESLTERTAQFIESESRFESFARACPSGLFFSDLEGNILFANESWYAISGHPRDVSLNEWHRSIHQDDVQFGLDVWATAIREQQPEIRIEIRWTGAEHKDSEYDRWTEVRCLWYTSSTGVSLGYTGSVVDISERKHREALTKRRAEDVLSQKLALTRFIDSLAHEVRNPLSAVTFSCALMLDDLTRPKASSAREDLELMVREEIETISLCARHIHRLVDGLLNLSKIEHDLITVTKTSFEPLTVIKQNLRMFAAEIKAKDIALTVVPGPGLAADPLQTFHSDQLKIDQIFINIITNAIKFTSKSVTRKVDVTVDVSTTRPKLPTHATTARDQADDESDGDDTRFLIVHVADTGCGLSSEEISRLFQRFAQASHSSSSTYGGSGLGLYISKKVVEEVLHGQIGLISAPGVGTTFSFYVTGARGEATETLPPPSPTPTLPSLSACSTDSSIISLVSAGTTAVDLPSPPIIAAVPTRQWRIVLAEDNKINSKLLTALLKRKGCMVSPAYDGQECIDILVANQQARQTDQAYDVVLMDATMPVKTGIEATIEIRQLEAAGKLTPRIPILAISANARGEQVDEMLAAGMDASLSKPFTIDALMSTLESLIPSYDSKPSTMSSSAGALEATQHTPKYSSGPRRSAKARSSVRTALPLVLLGLAFHLVSLYSIFDIYFVSPVIHVQRRFSIASARLRDGEADLASRDAQGSKAGLADRLVLIVGDGLRADKLFQLYREPAFDALPPFIPASTDGATVSAGWTTPAPYLRSLLTSGQATWGVSHTRVPTESRPGHVALIAGMYEDVSAVTKGWKLNPVNFDSVFNQSCRAWGFGSPDIVPMFEHGASPRPDGQPKMKSFCYDESEEDFTSDATALDVWVYNELTALFANASADATLAHQLREPQSIFFLHLLGLDTTGHSYRPHGPEYYHNIRVVDDIVQKVEQKFADFYGDRKTAFVFTADHGMSNIGNHGDGDPDNTRTPLIAWGSGVASHQLDGILGEWSLPASTRNDVAQADIASLMAALVGIPDPANSAGTLMTDYLAADKKYKVTAALANTRQRLEQYHVKHDLKAKSALRFKPFGELPDDATDARSSVMRLAAINEAFDRQAYDEAEVLQRELADAAQSGLDYLHRYDWLLLRSVVTAGYVGWMLLSLLHLLKAFVLVAVPPNLQPAWNLSALASAGLFASIGLRLALEKAKWTYFLYVAFPAYFFTALARNLPLIRSALKRISYDQLAQCGLAMVATVLVLELMLLGYFRRSVFSALFMLMGTVWLFATTTAEFQAEIRGLGGAWTVSCLAASAFTVLPVEKGENMLLIWLGGLGFAALGFAAAAKRPSPTLQSADIKTQPVAKATLDENQTTRYYLSMLTALIVVSMCVTSLSAHRLRNKQGLPVVLQAAGWILIALSLAVLVTSLQGRQHYIQRLLLLCLSFVPTFGLLSISYETLFYLTYAINLALWLVLETRLNAYRRRQSQPGESKLGLTHLRMAVFFLHYIHVGFFGTGNIASISSFYLEPVYRLVPVFNPFLMSALLIFKILIPFVFASAALAALQRTLGLPAYSISLLALSISDVLTMSFFYLIKTEGSWLEVGTSISHFSIASLLLVFIGLLSVLGQLIMAHARY